MPNKRGKCALHPDPRDAGEGAKLLGGADAQAAGVRVVTGGEEGPLLQLVHVFSYGCLESEALSAVGLAQEGISSECEAHLLGPGSDAHTHARVSLVASLSVSSC